MNREGQPGVNWSEWERAGVRRSEWETRTTRSVRALEASQLLHLARVAFGTLDAGHGTTAPFVCVLLACGQAALP